MNSTMILSFVSLAYMILLSIIFFSKQKIKSEELDVYRKIIITSVICLIFEIILTALIVYKFSMLNVALKIFNILIFTWIWFFGLYTYLALRRKKIRNFKKTIGYKIYQLFYLIIDVAILYLPIYINTEKHKEYSYGPSVSILFMIVGLMVFSMLIMLVVNYKNIKQKKNFPIIFLILMMGINTVVQSIWPHILLANSIFSAIAFIMYFTIENPDVKVIGELNRNKDILEKNNEERSNFLFRMTQEARKPISNIYNLANMIDTKNEYVKLEDVVNAIKSNTRQLSYVVNDVLDVSNIDIRKIKMIDTKYDSKRLFEEINLLIKDKIPFDVTYNYNISAEMPEMLYGDYIKLKQVIMSILINSVEHTSRGFIDLDVNVIIKYDMCRLIINVEDSGEGMDIQAVNNILTLDKPLDAEDEKKLDQMDVDLNITKKIINMIGGSIMIKSEVDKGTEFTVVIDQKIVDDNKNFKKINSFSNVKKVLIVDDNIDLLKSEKVFFEDHQVNVVSTMYGEDAVDKIRTGDNFDLIIIDDEMAKQSGVATLNQLLEVSNFSIPVIVMLEKNKEVIKKHYIEKGFKDYILKGDLQNEINRIVDSYLK